jgi:uncharacterized protein (DUF697 family)
MTSKPTLSTQEQIISDNRTIIAQNIIIDNIFWAFWTGAISIPMIDMLYVTVIQLKLINELSFEYGVKFSKNRAKAIVTSLTAGLGTSLLVKANLLGAIPAIGTLSSAAARTIFASAMTYAIGQVFVRHFESGGTFLDFDSSKYKDYFANMYKEGEKVAVKQRA